MDMKTPRDDDFTKLYGNYRLFSTEFRRSLLSISIREKKESGTPLNEVGHGK
jgi:hypothetical protein